MAEVAMPIEGVGFTEYTYDGKTYKIPEITTSTFENHVRNIWGANLAAEIGGRNEFPRHDQDFTKFYTTVYTDKELVPLLVKNIFDTFASEFKPFVSKFFEVKLSNDYTFEYKIRTSRPSPTPYGVQKVVGRSRGIKEYTVSGHTDYYIDAVVVDWYFLQKPKGIEEMNFKMKGAVEDIERTLLLEAIKTLTNQPKLRVDPNQRSQGVAFADTVAKVMENRATYYNCLNGENEYALETLIQRFNAMFSPNSAENARTTKVLVMKSRVLIESLLRNPRLFSVGAVGTNALKQARLWKFAGSLGDISVQTIPEVLRATDNKSVGESVLRHRLCTGSTFCFTNNGIGAVEAKDYTSNMLTLKVADVETNGWAIPNIITGAKSSIVMKKNGELDRTILMGLASSMDSITPTESLWNRTRVRDSIHNRRTAHIFLKYVKNLRTDNDNESNKRQRLDSSSAYKFVVPEIVGDLSSLVVDDNRFNYIFACVEERLTERLSTSQKKMLPNILDKNNTEIKIVRDKINRIATSMGMPSTDQFEELMQEMLVSNDNNLPEAGTDDRVGKRLMRLEYVSNLGTMKRIAAMMVLLSPINMHTFEKWYDNNIPLPFTGRVIRPYELYDAFDIWANNGNKLGVMHWNGIKTADLPQVDTRTKDILINLDTDAGFAILSPENHETIRNVMIGRCIGGNSSVFADQRVYHQMVTNEDRYDYVIRQNNSCFFTFMSLNSGVGESEETLRPVVSATGMYNSQHFKTELHNSADFNIQNAWNFEGQAILASTAMFLDKMDLRMPEKPTDDQLAASQLYNGYCNLVETRKYCPLYGEKRGIGHHVLGRMINNVRDRLLGKLSTVEIIAQNNQYINEVSTQPVIPLHRKKVFVPQ